VNKKVEEILSGFDRMIEKVDAMPVTPDEKRRLMKEWLRARLTEMTASDHDDGSRPSDNARTGAMK
jgi:hypothetical protein